LTEREDGKPHIKILDYGIAKFLADGPTAANATRSIGTPFYMAPEQFKTGSAVSAAADVYALGMVAYTFLVGVPYWKEDAEVHGNVFAFAMHALKGPEELASVRAKRFECALPAAFDAWFSKATALDPTQRFASAGEAVAALGVALNVFSRQGEGIATVLGLGNPLGGKTEPLGFVESRSSSPQLTPVSMAPSRVANVSPTATIQMETKTPSAENKTLISVEGPTSNPGGREKWRLRLTIGIAAGEALVWSVIAFRLSNTPNPPQSASSVVQPEPTVPTSTTAPLPIASSDARSISVPDSARSNAVVVEPAPVQANPAVTSVKKATGTSTRPTTKTKQTNDKPSRF